MDMFLFQTNGCSLISRHNITASCSISEVNREIQIDVTLHVPHKMCPLVKKGEGPGVKRAFKLKSRDFCFEKKREVRQRRERRLQAGNPKSFS